MCSAVAVQPGVVGLLLPVHGEHERWLVLAAKISKRTGLFSVADKRSDTSQTDAAAMPTFIVLDCAWYENSLSTFLRRRASAG